MLKNRGFAKGLMIEVIIITVVISILFIMTAKKVIKIKKDFEVIIEKNIEYNDEIENILKNNDEIIKELTNEEIMKNIK